MAQLPSPILVRLAKDMLHITAEEEEQLTKKIKAIDPGVVKMSGKIAEQMVNKVLSETNDPKGAAFLGILFVI